MNQRTYVVTSDSGTTVLVVLPDRSVEGYEAYRSYLASFEPHGHPIPRQQAADFIRRARLDFLNIFTRPYGLLRVEG